MRRDYFTLEVSNVEDDGMPTVDISFEGPPEQLRERLTDGDDEPLEPPDVDVAYRLRDPVDDPEAAGVVAIANRVTGAFILELDAQAEDVLAFISAARQSGDEGDRYRIRVAIEDDVLLDQEKDTLLVYEPDGELLRNRSLIPSGVEL